MTHLSKRLTLTIVIGLLVVAAGVTGALAATGELGSDQQQPPNVTSEISATLSSHYALFRRPVTAQDAIPPAPSGLADYGQNTDLARRVGDSGYYAVPGADDSLCLLTPIGSGICGRTPTEPTMLTSGMCKDGRSDLFHFVGLFPDGIDRVSITSSDGAIDSTVAVDLNGAAADLPKTDSSVTLVWTDGGGEKRSVPLPVPQGRMYCGEDAPAAG